MVRTTVGTIAEAQLSVQRTEAVTRIKNDQTATVQASNREVTSIFAPTGKLLSVDTIFIEINPPSGATTGRHNVSLRGPADNVQYLFVESGFSDSILIAGSYVDTATKRVSPSDAGAVNTAIQSIAADDSTPLVVRYENNTDADQTNRRRIRLVGVERGVTSA